MAAGDGQITETHSNTAGLNYPGVGGACVVKDSGHAAYAAVSDKEPLEAFHWLNLTEVIINPRRHAVAQAMEMTQSMRSDQVLLLNFSGRDDKDMHTVDKLEGFVMSFLLESCQRLWVKCRRDRSGNS